MSPLPQAMTPIEDQLQAGSADAELQALFDQLYVDQDTVLAAMSERQAPARHRQAVLLHQACSAAQRLIVEIWLRQNPGAA